MHVWSGIRTQDTSDRAEQNHTPLGSHSHWRTSIYILQAIHREYTSIHFIEMGGSRQPHQEKGTSIPIDFRPDCVEEMAIWPSRPILMHHSVQQ
jgi:hypothetical protein